MMMNQGTYATTFSGVFLEICEEIEEKTGITMDIQPVTDFMDVIQVKLATNEIPDIFVHNLPQNVKLFNAQENCVVMNDQPWFERMTSPDTVLYEDGNLYGMPIQSATWFPANISALKGEKETEALFRQKASARRDAVNRYLWDDENGIYRDYDWRREQLALFSAAAIVPLYVGMANHEQADRLANAVRSRLLTPGGILASEYETGEQWDKPNGWAPLQWMAIQELKMYGDDLLGDEIARNWLKTVNQFYLEQHKLIEKYHIADGVPREGGGGEYPLQDGFGWTNGVVRRLIGLYGEP